MKPQITQKFIDYLSHEIIGCAIEIHKEIGPGLLESAYENCLVYLLKKKGFKVESQVEVPITFQGIVVDKAYRLDLLVENLVVVEIKSVSEFAPIHKAQMLTYLKFKKVPKGILINFNCMNIFYEGQQTFITKEYAKLSKE